MKHAVPHKQQSTDYTCGPTCLEMLLDFYSIAYDREKMEQLCNAQPGCGTDNAALARAAESFGAKVEVKENASLQDIIFTIERGHPVLVNYFNCRSNVGHFGIVKGVDVNEQSLILADPKNGDDYPLTFDHFGQHWHNHTKTIHAWMMYLAE